MQRNTIENIRETCYKILVPFFRSVTDRTHYPVLNSVVTPCQKTVYKVFKFGYCC